jgi:hypothetical protein
MRRNAGQTLVALILVALISCVGIAHAEDQDISRGKRWVRSHPFWLSGLTQNPSLYEVEGYRGAGLNTLLAWDPKPLLFEKSAAGDLPIHYHMHQNAGTTTQDYINHVRGLTDKHPGMTGVLFYDEPRVPAMKQAGEVCDALRKAFPDLLIYSNAMPKGAVRPAKYGFGDDAPEDFYAAYLEHFAKVVRGDVVMIDIYPLGKDGGHSRLYFETITLVRQWGLKHGVPYWLFIAASDNGGRHRRPSESDLRFQLFAPLTYGFTGIAYFSYDPALNAGLIDANKNRTPLYYHAGRANMEVANVGRALRFLDSTGIAFVLGKHEEEGKLAENAMPPMPPPGTWIWRDVKLRPKQLRDVEVEGGGLGRDALIGFFKDDRGDDYFMVTNLWHEKATSAAACSQTITLKFTPDVKAVTRLSRETGAPEELVVRDGTLQLRLPGGTGDLFKIRDGQFPGLAGE